MTKLWILLAVSLTMAWLTNYRDRHGLHRANNDREYLITWLLIVVLGFFCGLRIWGNDTGTYIMMYNQVPLWEDFEMNERYDFAAGIGFSALTSILKTIGFSSQDYLMFYAFATVIPYVLFVRRYSENFVFGVFLMFATGFYTFSLAAIKQCMATGLCLWALNFALDRKWLRFSLLIAAAMLFHPYAIVYAVVPLMMFRPFTRYTFIYVGVFVAVGFYLETLLGTVLDITDMMGAEYTAEEFLGEGVNLFRVAVCFVPLVLGAIYHRSLFENATKTDHLMFNLAMLNALIMFVGLFGTANYFARLANYFLPAQVIVLPWILSRVHRHDRGWMTAACVAGYTGYFYYENAIIRPFDSGYAHMSLWEYLSDLF